LLLNKDAGSSVGNWDGDEIDYKDSTISGIMNTFANSTLNTTNGIIERTLTGGSDTYLASSGYNEDWVYGSNVTNQKVWPLSVDEASHLILSNRIFSNYWWLRNPGDGNQVAATVGMYGYIDPNGNSVDYGYRIRPALYLAISSTIFNGMDFRQGSLLPIGACAPQPNNLGIDYTAETVTGLDTDAPGWSLAPTFIGLSAPSVQTSAPIDIESNISNTASNLYFYKASMNTDIYFNSNTDSNGVAQESKSKLVIPARPAGPNGLTGVAPSDVGKSDGKITGTSNKMEYSTDEATWTSVTGVAITGLTSGTYFVRTIADQSASKFKSFATEVIVKAGSSPSSRPSAGPSAGPSTGGGGSPSEGTAQTGIDFMGLGLLLVLMMVGAGVLRSKTISNLLS
jgi:hypothetical protein